MTKADLELASERIISICRSLASPNEAYDVLGVAVQVIACMSEGNREQAMARIGSIMRQAHKELTVNYDTYMRTLKEAEERMARWEKLHHIGEALVMWLESDPPEPDHKAGDKTKH